MSIISVIVLALSMSADAFAVALCKGAADKNPRFMHALKTGALFGAVEGITPVIGWLLGSATSGFITAYDHWVAFILLGCIGLHMIYESLQKDEDEAEAPKATSFRRLLLTACATSIDALAVGITLAFMDANILVCASAIGAATFVMVTIGIMVGHHIGSILGKAAEALGGIALITIGSLILCEHLHLLG